MATANNPRMVASDCTICGERFEQAETAAIWTACRVCVRTLWCLIAGLSPEGWPGGVSEAAIAVWEGK